MEPQVGSILEGKVTSITKFGAFVAVEGGRSGLVHISEIANTYVNDVRDYLQEGQTVRVLVLPAANGKLNFSMKRLQPQAASRPAPARSQARPAAESGAVRRDDGPPAPGQPLPPSGDKAFEDKLKHFLSASEGKMADLHRSIDGKRGGRRRR